MTPVGQKYQHLQLNSNVRGYQGVVLSKAARDVNIRVAREEYGLGLVSGNIDITGHSLAYAISISLSTIFKNIGTVSGFNGAGAKLEENSNKLSTIALLSGNQFDLNRGIQKSTNYVGEGIRLVASDLPYKQNGNIVVVPTGANAIYEKLLDENDYPALMYFSFKDHGIRTLLTHYNNSSNYGTYFEAIRKMNSTRNASSTIVVSNAFDLIKNTDLNRKNVINTGKDIAFSSNAISL
ncbi:hypothetical protein INT80_00625 [Gallibacterium anatis]|uniref:Uncharacterized protein n=1 Tax=Gallibacterium anatis TaxID=750 RepID=A0A930UW13_9PAST|nr:hypothetical protein [Gallibacterium anatis]